MKFIVIILVLNSYQSIAAQSVTPSNGGSSAGAINLSKLFNFLKENIIPNIQLCDDGFTVQVSGDYLSCVQDNQQIESRFQVIEPFMMEQPVDEAPSSLSATTNIGPGDEAPSSLSTTTNIAPSCPSFGCPQNPSCNPGDHLVTFAENCCCVKEDVFREESIECPPCSISQPGLVDCECNAPLKKYQSFADPSTKCCFLEMSLSVFSNI